MKIGVDLGSTNTTACLWDGRLRMIEMSQSGATSIPSVVTIVGNDVLIGQEAVEAGRMNPDYDFRNFKRNLAQRWHDEEDTGFQTMRGPDGMLHYRGPGEFTYSPTELCAHVLAEVVKRANAFLAPHDTVTGAVIGVPATFEPDQIAAVKEAARLAGLEDVSTLEEPVAAAIANGVDAKRASCTFVVDFGGGTLDTSILRAGGGLNRIVAKNGISDLGGTDFDKRIADYVTNLFRTEHRKLIDENVLADNGQLDRVMSKILVEAEAVKKRLSDKEETTFRLENVTRTKDGVTLHMIYPVDRTVFGELTKDLVERMISACKATIDDARRKDPKFTIRDISGGVLLVGGMTRVPAVRQAVTDFFGKAPRKDENPEMVVAQGLAIKAAIIEGRRPDVTVEDITSLDVAIETTNEIPAIIIPRGSPFPLEKTFTLSNETDEQTELSVRLLYATRPRATDCHLLDAQDVTFPAVPAETLRAKLVVRIDEEGHPSIVSIAA